MVAGTSFTSHGILSCLPGYWGHYVGKGHTAAPPLDPGTIQAYPTKAGGSRSRVRDPTRASDQQHIPPGLQEEKERVTCFLAALKTAGLGAQALL